MGVSLTSFCAVCSAHIEDVTRSQAFATIVDRTAS